MNDIFGVGMRTDVCYTEFMKVTIVIYDQPRKRRPPMSWGLSLAVPMQTYVYIVQIKISIPHIPLYR